MPDSYFGWKNWQSWLAFHWLASDECKEKVRKLSQICGCDIKEFAKLLEFYVQKNSPLGIESYFYAEVIRNALGEVDWLEVAKELKTIERGD